MPPTLPGTISDPRTLGGVKIPSERSAAIRSRHHFRSASEPWIRSTFRDCGESGFGRNGQGAGGGGHAPRHVALRHRPLLDAEDRLAGGAIEDEKVTGLRADADRGDRPAPVVD